MMAKSAKAAKQPIPISCFISSPIEAATPAPSIHPALGLEQALTISQRKKHALKHPYTAPKL
jgi:hypothetical protein